MISGGWRTERVMASCASPLREGRNLHVCMLYRTLLEDAQDFPSYMFCDVDVHSWVWPGSFEPSRNVTEDERVRCGPANQGL